MLKRNHQEIENNEAQRKELQRRIDEAIDSDRNKTFLRILTQYRLLVSFSFFVTFQLDHQRQQCCRLMLSDKASSFSY